MVWSQINKINFRKRGEWSKVWGTLLLSLSSSHFFNKTNLERYLFNTVVLRQAMHYLLNLSNADISTINENDGDFKSTQRVRI